jgi:glycosyltransferase involved in cell wall biosynthesis
MKICIIGPTHPYRGGISMYSSLLYQELSKKHETKLISFKKQYPAFLYPGKSDKDFASGKKIEIPCERIFDPLSPVSWYKTCKNIVDYSPDVVLIHWWVTFFAPGYYCLIKLLKKYSRIPIIFLCHNVIEHEASYIKNLLTSKVLKCGDFFIVQSSKDEQKLIEIIHNIRKIKKVHHPLYDVYRFTGMTQQDAMTKLGEKSSIIILFFGLVREYKGLKYLIEAMSLLPPTLDLKLYIVGEFWEDKTKYSSMIESFNLHNVIIKDEYIPNEEVETYFAASDLVILPYVSATGSGIVQAAYGFDKPVIVTNVGALPEVVVEGKSGYIVPPKDPKSIADKITQFFTSDDKMKFNEFIMEYKKKFSFKSVVEVIEEFVEN